MIIETENDDNDLRFFGLFWVKKAMPFERSAAYIL